jgi:Fe-S-cluster containining protein
MAPDPLKDSLNPYRNIFNQHKNRLKDIYRSMDEHYGRVSRGYGFECIGCTESCCETRFYHHTWIEFFYLIEGFGFLGKKERQQIKHTAMAVIETYRKAGASTKSVRIMCPLNVEGLCRIYDYRPMICRLHGIPHEVQKPGRQAIEGPGCHFFAERYGTFDYIPFDRTPFYQEMAVLEQTFRKAIGNNNKIKMTIAEMLLLV